MTIKIKVDPGKRDGFGNCVVAADDIFDLDYLGCVRLKIDTVGDDRLTAVSRAAYECPVNAITYVQE